MFNYRTTIIFLLCSSCAMAQGTGETYPVVDGASAPEPVLLETMIGHKWGMFQSIISKKLTPRSHFNFFNLTNYEVSYDRTQPAAYIVQSVAYYEPFRNWNLGLGANLKAFSGFKPLAAVAYNYSNRNITVIAQPSIELHKDGVAELFALAEYRGASGKKVEPYGSIQSATSFSTNGTGHSFTYVNGRLGVQYGNFRVGPAINLRIIGRDAYTECNIGGFIGLLIF